MSDETETESEMRTNVAAGGTRLKRFVAFERDRARKPFALALAVGLAVVCTLLLAGQLFARGSSALTVRNVASGSFSTWAVSDTEPVSVPNASDRILIFVFAG